MAVMMWSPAWMSTVWQRRAVLVNFRLDQPVRFPVPQLTAAGLVRSFEQAGTIKDCRASAPGR